jgi:putative colanic acid biosynthesis UDP-glucose lipid carrier transferase
MIRTVLDAHLQISPDLAFPLRRPLDARGRLVAVDRQSILTGLVRACDLAAALGGAIVAYALRYGSISAAVEYCMFTLLGTVLLVNYLHLSHAYDFEAIRRLRAQISKVFVSWFAVIIALSSLAYFFGLSSGFSRGWMVIWFCTTLLMLLTTRVVAVALIARWQHSGQLVRRIAIIGTPKRVERVARHVASQEGVAVVSTVTSVRRVASHTTSHNGTPQLVGSGDVDKLLSLARSCEIDEIIVVSRSLLDPALRDLVRTLRSFAIEVRLYAIGLHHSLPPGKLDLVFGLPLLSIVERPLTGWTRVAKRAEDVCISSVLLLFLFPLIALIALAIKLDTPGPVLFRQDRLGFNNNPVRVFKFRSMHHRPEREDMAEQVRRNDTRVTRIGRLLRRTSLDELPQLFNVLMGDMSLVGPRPHPLALNEKFAHVIDGYLARHRVKPGITGWAQVNGLRGETDTIDKMQRRVEHDLYYIDNWSLVFDLKILFSTVFVGFVHENAY